MVASKIQIHTGHTVEVNAYHVTIRSGGLIVFKRSDEALANGAWLDEPHQRITKALSELETAIIAAVGGTNE